MKTILFTTLLLLSTLAGYSQKDLFTVHVDGLGCPFCAYGLEETFKEEEGISKIKIDLKKGILTYELPAARAMTIQAVEKRVTEAGYTPRSVTIQRADGRVETSVNDAPVVVTQTHAGQRSIVVGGACEMCKARIEKTALGVRGVKTAVWDASTQSLALELSPEVHDLEPLKQALAKVGHDTDTQKASDKVYQKLPPCCHYRQ